MSDEKHKNTTAVLLFTAGRMVARQARLVERVRVLEEKIENLVGSSHWG